MECTNYDFLRLIVILRNLITIAKIAIPVILMVIGVVDLLKIVTAGTPEAVKEAVKKLALRFVAGAVIFFLPSIVHAFMGLVSDYSDARNTYKTCVENSKNLDYYKQLKEEKKAQEKAEREAKTREAAELRKEQVAAIKATEETKKKYDNSTPSDGTHMGTKHELSDSDISFIAGVALCEEDEAGVKASASQIVNRYELFAPSGKSIADYVRTSGWWSCAKNPRSATESAKSTVKNVIVLGNRMFPPYVDEHDCYNCNDSNYCGNGNKGDICYLKTNGNIENSMSAIKNHASYKQDQTVIGNVYGSSYTFYAFGCDNCDPFGYTASSKAKYDSLNNS